MATSSTVLCIHRDPAQLSFLEQNGYELVTATSGCEGLRLFMSRHVDAIVLEYHLGLLDGAVIATEIKQLRPEHTLKQIAAWADDDIHAQDLVKILLVAFGVACDEATTFRTLVEKVAAKRTDDPERAPKE